MDKIFHSTFDFFSHAIPGACVAIAFYLLDKDLNTFNQFLEMAANMKIGSAVLIISIGYIIGFAMYPIGRYLYKKLGSCFLKAEKDIKVKKDELDLFISNKFILIRELSPNNFKYIEIWHMFCAMSHNLAVASLLIMLLSLIKIFFLNPGNLVFWWLLVFGLFILFILFLHRAAIFSVWAANDLNAAIIQLNLVERAKKLPENKEG